MAQATLAARVIALSAVLVAAASARDAGAAEGAGDTGLVKGTVVARHSAWTDDHRRIVTTTTIATASGNVDVQQLGGTADGIGMSVFHGPDLAEIGDRITVETTTVPSDENSTAAAAPSTVTWVRAMYRGIATGSTASGLPRMEFTRTTTTVAQAPVYWKSGCVYITYAAEGTREIPGDLEFDVLDAAIREWVDETRSCSYLQVLVDPPEEREVGFDRVNLIKFRDTDWGRPAVGNDPAETYQPEAGGLTTLFYFDQPCSSDQTAPCPDSDPRNGQILDADIELNGVNYAISVDGQSSGSAQCLSDLQNTVTHELGHLFGLDHTCWQGSGFRPVDEDGDPIPSCNDPDLPASVEEATMYNFQDCGETTKATLESDDVDGFCSIYPVAEDPGTCAPVGEPGGCCSIAGGRDQGRTSVALWLAIAAALARVLRRRGDRGRYSACSKASEPWRS